MYVTNSSDHWFRNSRIKLLISRLAWRFLLKIGSTPKIITIINIKKFKHFVNVHFSDCLVCWTLLSWLLSSLFEYLINKKSQTAFIQRMSRQFCLGLLIDCLWIPGLGIRKYIHKLYSAAFTLLQLKKNRSIFF